MYHAHTWREKSTLFLAVLWPIIITQVGFLAMNVVDTIMSGRFGTDDLAGVAIGANIWMPVFTGINGILMAVTPIVAQLLGSGKSERIAFVVTQSLYVSVVLGGLVIGAGFVFLDPILTFMDLEPAVHHIAFHYLAAIAIGIIPFFVANVLRNFFDGQGFTRITMLITILAIPFNVVLNYGFIFGHFGLPALGGIGAGYATAITYWLMLIFSAILTFVLPTVNHFRIFLHWSLPSLRSWKEQLAIGIPIGLSIFFEASTFSVVALLIGVMFATETIAANQVALSFTSLIFMVPLSISMALTIVVGYSVGGKRLQAAKQYTIMGVLSGIGFVGICSVLLFVFRTDIAGLYSNDPIVITMAAQFFIFAIMYQFSDACQSSLQGVLRGYKDVQVPFMVAFVSYWLIGIPAGYLLAAYTALGAYGFWIGITLGLTGAAIGFFVRLRIIQRRAARVPSVQP